MSRTLVLAIAVLAVSGCGGGDADPLGLPSRAPDFTGEVKDRDADGRILVVPNGDPCGYWVAVGMANVVDVDVRIEAEAIERGWRARVWINSGIAESCPGQTSAETVEILPR